MRLIKTTPLVMSILALGLIACSKTEVESSSVTPESQMVSQAGVEQKNPTFVYCSEASPEGFDPGLYTTGPTFDAASITVYNRLAEFKEGTTEVIPALAQKWDISADNLEYTFHLRPNVKFQTTSFFTPTRSLTADDVIFSFNRQLDANNPWHKYVAGASWEYAVSMGFPELIKAIEKVDDLTVKFTLTKPDATFVANLAMPFIPIMSAEYAQHLADTGQQKQLNQKPLGTGPFIFVKYQQDANIRYVANPDYWAGKPKIDLVFLITPDASVRYQKLQRGECHLMPYPNNSDIDSMRKNPALKLIEQEGLNVAYLAFNTKQKPFDDIRVRQALNMAVDKQAIIEAVFQGLAQPAKNPLPPTIWSYNEAVEDYAYNLAEAKKLLQEAGVDKLTMKLWAMPVARPYMLNARRAAEIMQGDFAKIGVKAEIVTYEWAEYQKRSRDINRDGAVIMGWTGDNGDPDNFLDTLLGCEAVGTNNHAQWCNAEYNQLVKQAKLSTDKAERTKLYQQAQLIFKREAPWVTLVHSKVIVPLRKEVQGFVKSPLGTFSFTDVSLEK